MEREQKQENTLTDTSHMEPDDMLPSLVEMGRKWLMEQRDIYHKEARNLSYDEKRRLRGYFDDETLDRVRIATVERISNPLFYDELRESGHPVLDISQSAGMTFNDCIVIRSLFQEFPQIWISILFHELVHVVQYDILGPGRLVELYLHSWAQNEYNYNAISFEEQAQRLEDRFQRGHESFSVRGIVEEELRGIEKSAP